MNGLRKLPWLALLLASLALAVGTAACGGDDGDEGNGGAAAETGEGGGEQEAIKVGLVSDTGGLDDRGFNEFSINGLERAEEELSVDGRVYESRSADDYLPNLTAAAEDGSNLVVAVGFLLGHSVSEAAAEYTEVNFAGVDNFYGEEPDCGEDPDPPCVRPNTLGLIYPSEEPGYLAGIVAAMMTKTGTVSTVGGEKIPPVDNWIAGFQQAIKDTKPSVKMLNQYSQDFVDPAKCKEIALDQIRQGSDIVFQVAGKCGLGAIDAACEEGKMAIGVDADQSAAGDCVITSALKPLETSVFDVIQRAQEGRFEGGQNLVFSVQDYPEADLLAPFADAVPQNVRDAVAAAQEKLISGEIDPPAELGK
ncbi:MAG TPA: BMP family ABC transporter substrate-binding protein [Gaiellaceae bacterium]|nr:BMP family ABC transporter substrate-binding protein [Gaiellaceae bacterium]